MQGTAAKDTTGASQLQVIGSPDTTRDQRMMKVEYEGRVMEISLDEMAFYVDLFEEMLDDLDRSGPAWTMNYDGLLDEFDHAEIEHLRLQHGTVGPF
jgi:hypothetical protein